MAEVKLVASGVEPLSDGHVATDGWGAFYVVASCDVLASALFIDSVESYVRAWVRDNAQGRVGIHLWRSRSTPYYEGIASFAVEDDAHLFRLKFA